MAPLHIPVALRLHCTTPDFTSILQSTALESAALKSAAAVNNTNKKQSIRIRISESGSRAVDRHSRKLGKQLISQLRRRQASSIRFSNQNMWLQEYIVRV
jgi:hypothetical protein